jgi:hypothetical protein
MPYRSDPSHVVKTWARRTKEVTVPEPKGYRGRESEGVTFTLEGQVVLPDGTPSRVVRCHFTVLPEFRELVRIRSVNWRVENEISGFMPIVAARRLYRDCLAAGMRLLEEGR